jgi:hypothetical protein
MIVDGKSVTSTLDKQKESILSDEEKNNKISTIESILAGVGSGLIQIPKGVFSLGATLIDMGSGTNKAAQVEKYFDDLTTWDEKARATTVGKITELLVNIGVPGGIGFKIGTKLASQALRSKKAGTYFSVADKTTGKILTDSATKLARLNQKGRVAKFAAGAITGGAAEGIFIGDVEHAGTFGELLGGPTRLHKDDPDNPDPARNLLNRVKFGTEGALFTGLLGGIGKTLKLLSGRTEALRYADNAIDKRMFNFLSHFKKEGKMTPELFEAQRKIIGQKYADINVAQTIGRNLNKKIDAIFPWTQRIFDRTTKANRKEFLGLLNDGLISGKPKVLDSGVVRFGEKTKIGWGGIAKSQKDDVFKFLKKNKIAYDDNQVKAIFDQMEAMRAEWADMFSTLGRGIKKGDKLKVTGLETTFKDFQKLFGDKFKNYIGATYDAFSNHSLIPMLNYKVPTEVADKAIRVFRAAASANKTPITYQEAQTLVNNMVKTATAPKNFDQDAMVHLPNFFVNRSMLQKATSKGFDISQLTPEKKTLIKEVLGKTRDPIETIMAQTGEVSAVTRRNQLLTDMSIASVQALKAGRRPLLYDDEGLKMIPTEIFKTAKKLGDSYDASMYRRIETEGMSSGIANPAGGKWALKEVADAIEAASGKTTTNFTNHAVYRNLILFPKATAQMAKTILTPITHARNFLSAGAFSVANGLIPGITITPRMMKSAWKNLQVAGPGTRAESEFYQKLARLGVVNTNVRLGDLQALFKDVDFGSVVGADKGLRGMLKPLSKIKKWTEDAYTAEDDFWKIATFLGERARFARAYKSAGKNITEDQLDEMAANIVRNNVPNYDYVSQSIKALRKWPVGNFVSFPAEILRTTTNILRTALREIKDPALRSIGWQRLMGMGFTMGAVPYGATKLGQYIYDVSEDELAALRRIGVAPWSKNSTIIPIKENGEFKYIDFSHANAYDTIVRPWQTAINEVADGQLNDEAIMNNFLMGSLKGFGEIVKPFYTESIWTEALADVFPIIGRGGRSAEGYTIYDAKNDTPGTIADKIFIHLLKAQMPGSLKQLGRIDYALTDFDTPLQAGEIFGGGPTGRWKWGKIGEYDENGQSYELLDEGLGIAGMRAVKVNVARTLKFKHAEYASNTRKSRSMFTRVALKEGPVDPAELVEAYITANKAMWKVQKEMKANMDAAYTLGTSQKTVKDSLARMSKKDFNYVGRGYFQSYRPSDNVIKGIYNNARKIGVPNAWIRARAIINNIARQLRFLRTDPGSEFPDFVNPLRQITDTIEGQQGSLIQDNVPIQTPEVSEEVVRTSALPSNVNQNTGLTSIEEALLSSEEKAMRLRQRGMTA